MPCVLIASPALWAAAVIGGVFFLHGLYVARRIYRDTENMPPMLTLPAWALMMDKRNVFIELQQAAAHQYVDCYPRVSLGEAVPIIVLIEAEMERGGATQDPHTRRDCQYCFAAVWPSYENSSAIFFSDRHRNKS